MKSYNKIKEVHDLTNYLIGNLEVCKIIGLNLKDMERLASFAKTMCWVLDHDDTIDEVMRELKGLLEEKGFIINFNNERDITMFGYHNKNLN